MKKFCTYSQEGCWSVVFFSCDVFIWFCHQNQVSLLEWVRNYFFLFNFLQVFVQKGYYFFLKCSMEFISESIRVLSFLVCRFFNCEFNFLSRFRAIQVIYLFLRKLTIASLQLFLHSIEVTKFIRKKLMRFPYHHVICMESIVTSSLSPTIGNFVFPLFFSD